MQPFSRADSTLSSVDVTLGSAELTLGSRGIATFGVPSLTSTDKSVCAHTSPISLESRFCGFMQGRREAA
jgi:hypothetical protein